MRAFDTAFRLSKAEGQEPVANASRTIEVGPAALTRREHEVLVLLVEGDTNQEIARKLRIREQTVKDHVSVLCRKFYVRRRVALAVSAVRAGL